MKFKCSLKWLSGILSESPGVQEQATLLEPYHDGKLKNSLVLLLTTPSLYISAYEVLFPGEHVDGGSFEPLIHGLAKKGGYVLEDDTNIVTGPMLAQESSFMEVWLRNEYSRSIVLFFLLSQKAHLALLDVLMIQYASKHITVHTVVRTVRYDHLFDLSQPPMNSNYNP